MPHWLVILSCVSIGLGVISATAIGVDVRRHPQRMPIMNIVWPVTGLYLPLAAWWAYSSMGRPMAIGSKGMAGVQRHWKSIFLSATHCASGCVIGDCLGAPIVFATRWTLAGERLYAEFVFEFALAYAFGIAFQYFPIRAMRRLSTREAIADAIKADTLSLAAFEVGMFGWMALSHFILLASKGYDVANPVFWLVMQIGMVLGFLTTYPANWLLVKWGVKSGM